MNNRAVGTIWIVMHDDASTFDLEDKRLLEDLGDFAAAAYSLRTVLDQRDESDRRKDEFLATLGYGQVEDRQRALEAGFDRHLVKPIDPGSLETLIASSVAP